MKSMPIIWEKPDIYSNHVVLIESFHTIMNALKMAGHKMAGSGYMQRFLWRPTYSPVVVCSVCVEWEKLCKIPVVPESS